MDLETTIEKHYNNELVKDYLKGIINKKLNEQYYVSMPQLTPAIGKLGHPEEYPDEGPGSDKKLRDINEFIRSVMAAPFVKSLKNDRTIKGRIDKVNSFLNGDDTITVPEFVSIITFIQEFSKIIREYDTADKRLGGYQFEMLMSIFFDGSELFGTVITDFKAVIDGHLENISVKFIEKQSYPRVTGNIKNFINETFDSPHLTYLICLKDVKAQKYYFYEIPIEAANFDKIFNWSDEKVEQFFGPVPFLKESVRFEKRKSGETNEQYKQRLLDRISDTFYAYKKAGVGLDRDSPTLFSKEFSVQAFSEESWYFIGALDFSNEKLTQAYNFYKGKILGEVGALLNLASIVNKDMITFFANFSKNKTTEQNANKVSRDIQKLNNNFNNFIVKNTST